MMPPDENVRPPGWHPRGSTKADTRAAVEATLAAATDRVLSARLSPADRGRIIRGLDELRAIDRLIRETPVSYEAVG
jgi:hypothetical protein